LGVIAAMNDDDRVLSRESPRDRLPIPLLLPVIGRWYRKQIKPPEGGEADTGAKHPATLREQQQDSPFASTIALDPTGLLPDLFQRNRRGADIAALTLHVSNHRIHRAISPL
jgi:hypothetical protein